MTVERRAENRAIRADIVRLLAAAGHEAMEVDPVEIVDSQRALLALLHVASGAVRSGAVPPESVLLITCREGEGDVAVKAVLWECGAMVGTCSTDVTVRGDSSGQPGAHCDARLSHDARSTDGSFHQWAMHQGSEEEA